MVSGKMFFWFLFWRVKKKFEDCMGLFFVGCMDFMCVKNDCVGVIIDVGSFICFFYLLKKIVEKLDELEMCFWIFC